MITNPSAFIRDALEIDAGGLANKAIDMAANKVCAAYTAQVSAACGVANGVINVVNLLKGPSAPDVYLAYATYSKDLKEAKQKQVSPVYKDATFNDLRFLSGLPSLTIACDDLDTPFAIGVVDRETDVPLTTDTLDPKDQLIGGVGGTLRTIGADAINQGFTYLTPNESNGVIAVGVSLERIR